MTHRCAGRTTGTTILKQRTVHFVCYRSSYHTADAGMENCWRNPPCVSEGQRIVTRPKTQWVLSDSKAINGRAELHQAEKCLINKLDDGQSSDKFQKLDRYALKDFPHNKHHKPHKVSVRCHEHSVTVTQSLLWACQCTLISIPAGISAAHSAQQH